MTHSTSVISHLYIKREAAGVARLVLFFCYVYEARAATTNRKRSEHIWCWKETDAWCAREFFALKNSKDYHSHHSRVAVRLKITKHHLEWTCVLLFVEIFHENELGRLFSFFFFCCTSNRREGLLEHIKWVKHENIEYLRDIITVYRYEPQCCEKCYNCDLWVPRTFKKITRFINWIQRQNHLILFFANII